MELLALLSSAIPGLVLFITGFLKALAPSTFIAFLGRLDLIPGHWRHPFTAVVAFGQALLGCALVLAIRPRWTAPLAIGVIAILALFTLWAMQRRNNTDDCGCYGPLAVVPPKQSLLLDAGYIALLAVSWRFAGPPRDPAADFRLLAAGGLFLAPVAVMGLWASSRFTEDLLDMSPLRAGKAWNPTWAEGWKPAPEQLVILMRQGCKTCQEWGKLLNRISQRADMPAVLAVMAGDKAEVREYAAGNGCLFPMLAAKPSTVDRLTNSYPAAVYLRDGKIVERLAGRLPDTVLERLKSQPPAARLKITSEREGIA